VNGLLGADAIITQAGGGVEVGATNDCFAKGTGICLRRLGVVFPVRLAVFKLGVGWF
jgi:hypothetical protein